MQLDFLDPLERHYDHNDQVRKDLESFLFDGLRFLRRDQCRIGRDLQTNLTGGRTSLKLVLTLQCTKLN